MSETFLLGFPPQAIREAINQDPSKPYTELAAIVSLALDIDIDRSMSVRDYARIWNWSKSKVYREMPELRKEAEKWLSWYGKKRGTAVGQQWDSSGTKKEPKSNICDGEWDSSGTAVGQSRDTNYTVLQNSEEIHTDHSLTSFENVSENKNGISKPKKKSVSKKKSFDTDSWQYLFSEDFYRRLVSNEVVSEESVTEKKIQSGAATFDLMLRTSKIKPNPDTSEIAETMIWLLNPTCWWMENRAIRSPNKLLENHKKNGCTYYETIRGQFLAEKSNRNGASRSRGIAEAVARQMAPGSFFA